MSLPASALLSSCHVIRLLPNQGLNPIKRDEHVQNPEAKQTSHEELKQLHAELIKHRLNIGYRSDGEVVN